MKKTAAFLLGLTLTTAALLGAGIVEQAIADFAKIGAAYERTEQLGCTIKQALYESYNSPVPLRVDSTLFFKKGNSSYIKNKQFESVTGERFSLQVLPDEKVIYLILMPPKNKIKPFSLQEHLGSGLTACTDLKYSEADGTGTYSFAPPGGELEKVEVAFSRKSHMLQSVKSFFAQPQELIEGKAPTKGRNETTFAYIDASQPTIPEEAFKMENYVAKKNSEYIPTEKFKGYRVSVIK